MFTTLNQASSSLIVGTDAQISFTIALAALLVGLIAGFIVVAVLPGVHSVVSASFGFCLAYLVAVVLIFVHSRRNPGSQIRLVVPSLIFFAGVLLSLLQFS